MIGTRGFVCFSACLGFLMPAAVNAGEPEMEVVCPAIRIDDRARTESPLESHQPPELVVLGKARKVNRTNLQSMTYEVTIEKILYGDWADKTLRFSGYRSEGRHIFALAPAQHEGGSPFRLRYYVDAAEEKAMKALYEARLDFNVLASRCLFIGKDIERIDTHQRTVEVIRPLFGEGPAKGQRVTVYLGRGEGRVGSPPVLHKEPAIYFIHEIKRKSKDNTEVKNTIYYAVCRQPASVAAEVPTILKRKNDHPILERKEGGKTVRYREVMFRGSTTEAIELLGSESGAVVALGGRKLIHEARATRVDVVAAIEPRLLRLRENQRGEPRCLDNLIHVLGSLPGEQAKTELHRLADKHIDYLAARVDKADDKEVRGHEEHALSWLLQQLGEPEVYRRHGRRLIRLRDRAKGQCKHELQLALDDCRIEDHFELATALARLKDIKPLRSSATLYHDGRPVLAFSHDGKYLASAGGDRVRVWNTGDWSLAAQFTQEGSIVRICFSPDDRLLYLAGGGTLPIQARFDWRTGKVDKSYTSHKSGLGEMGLSADGRRMATADYYDKVFHITDTKTGKVLYSFPLKDYEDSLTLSADGKLLIRAKKQLGKRGAFDRRSRYANAIVEWSVEALDGSAPSIEGLAGKDTWLFSPAGRYLVSAEPPPDKDGQVTLRVHDGRKGFAVITSRKGAALGTWMTISANGKRLAVLDRGRDMHGISGALFGKDRVHFTILSLPDLKPVGEGGMEEPKGIEVESLALSADGKLLAMATSSHSAPWLFDTNTGKRIAPAAGHSDHVRSVHFLPDGKTIRTLCADSSIYLWDAATLRLRQRIALPTSWQFLSAREPDGKYLLCRDTARQDGKSPVLVVDADNGRTIATLKPPEKKHLDPERFRWINDPEVIGLGEGFLIRFDCRTGKILGELNGVEATPGTPVEPSADGKSLDWIDCDPHFAWLTVCSLDLTTGKFRKLPGRRLPSRPANEFGLVPGGKYVYAGDPGLYLLDRRTLKIVAHRDFRKTDLLSVDFTADGKRYAVVTGGAIFLDERLQRWDPGTRSLVRIHDALSGKTLAALYPATRWVKVRFRPDGKRLAVINDDATLELWDLSSLANP